MESLLSVIVPLYNEEGLFVGLRERLEKVASTLDLRVEFVLVDDHSADRTAELARSWALQDSRVRYVRLSRNFGSHSAYAAGLCHCQGDCAVFLVADLQNPPETISQMVAKWREGYQVVWGCRRDADHGSFLNNIFSFFAYRILRRILPEWPKNGTDFVLVDRLVMDAYNAMQEKNTNVLCTISWFGFRRALLSYEREPRRTGRSKWTFFKRIKLFLDMFVSFSYFPIRMASAMGLVISAVGMGKACIVFYDALHGQLLPGWGSLMVVVLVLGGFQLLTLGILGEYLWRTYEESRARPRFLVEQMVEGTPTLQGKSNYGAGAPSRGSSGSHVPMAG